MTSREELEQQYDRMSREEFDRFMNGVFADGRFKTQTGVLGTMLLVASFALAWIATPLIVAVVGLKSTWNPVFIVFMAIAVVSVPVFRLGYRWLALKAEVRLAKSLGIIRT